MLNHHPVRLGGALFGILFIVFCCSNKTPTTEGKIREARGKGGNPQENYPKEASLFEKKLFYQPVEPILPIRGLALLDSDPNSGSKVIVFAQSASFSDVMLILDAETKNLSKRVEFGNINPKPGELTISNPEIVDVKEDGHFRIMQKGGGYSEVGLLTDDGKKIWVFRPNPKRPPSAMAAGDVDGNGILEFYVCDYDGLYRLDSDGKVVWKANYPLLNDVAVYDSGGIAERLILTTGGTGNNSFQFWNAKGTLLREIRPPVEEVLAAKSLGWPSPRHILSFSGTTFYVFDFDANIVLQHSLSEAIYNIKGTSVKFSDKDEPYLAVLAQHSSTTSLSELCIFSSNGELVYKETLKTTYALLAFHPEKSKTNVLLIGSRPIYEYRLNPKK